MELFSDKIIIKQFQDAGVVELVDTHGLGPCAARRGGSSPFSGTIKN